MGLRRGAADPGGKPLSQDPVAMAGAFADAVDAGHAARRAGAMQAQDAAQASTPVLGMRSA